MSVEGPYPTLVPWRPAWPPTTPELPSPSRNTLNPIESSEAAQLNLPYVVNIVFITYLCLLYHVSNIGVLLNTHCKLYKTMPRQITYVVQEHIWYNYFLY